MSENEEKIKNQTKNQLKEKENLDIMFNNNTESYQIMKNQNIKRDEKGKKKALINYEEIKNNEEDIPQPRTRKRSNSVDLYKKHKREKERKKQLKKDSTKNIKENNIASASPDITNIQTKRPNQNSKYKDKKVSFPKDFVTVIDVESYKQYNVENTSKDPFDDLEFLKNINNINNYNINININNNKDEDEGKERVMCSCLIY